MTLGELRDSVYARRWKGSRSEKTAKAKMDYIVDLLGKDTPLRAIGPAEIDRLVDDLLGRDLANSTVNRYLARLKTALNHARDRGWIAAVPKIELRRERAGRIRFLSEDEERKVIAYFNLHDRPDLADLVAVMVDTGLRVSNAVDLCTSQIQGNRIIVHADQAKGGKTYSVPMTHRTTAIVQARGGGGLIGATTRKPIFPDIASRHTVTKWWKRMRDDLGITDKDFVPHACRHTFCSRLVQAGVPIQHVKELAGHSDISLTLRYSHLRADDLTAAINKLNPSEDSGPQLRLAE